MSEPARSKKQGDVVATLPGTFALTELGNAERLVAQYRDRIRFCPPRKRWLLWDGKRWGWDERLEISRLGKLMVRAIYGEAERCQDDEQRRSIVKHARNSESEARINAAIRLAQSEVAVLPEDLDGDPWAFNVLNGTIDLRTGQIRPHRRADLITKLSPVEYDPSARSDLWEQYLRDATGNDAELTTYLQRSVGYAMQGTVTEKAFWFLHGPPDGMKSTFIDAVDGAFGEYHVPTSFETWLVQSSTGGNRGDLVRLMGARLVSSVEVRKGARFDESILKAVTGGDAITAAAKYEAELTFYATFALWLAANDRPTIRDDDEGAWSRVRQVPFVHPLPKERRDPAMRSRLREPATRAAILAWAVQGCLEWQRERIGTCSAVERSTAEYRAEMDRVAGFFEERCAFATEATVPASDVRKAYVSWCEEQGIKVPLTVKDFAVRLKDKECEPRKSGSVRLWKGIRLISAWETSAAREGTQGQDGTGFPGTPLRKFSSHLLENDVPTCPNVPVDDPERESIQGKGWNK